MKQRSIFLLDPTAFGIIYNEQARRSIDELTLNDGVAYLAEDILGQPGAFEDVEIIFSGWDCPTMNEELLQALPNLKAFFYGAGSVRKLVTDAFWRRGILLTSSYRANATPVAEFTVAAIVFALKQVWTLNRQLISREPGMDRFQIAGAYHGSSVGIISLGAIGQLVCEKLYRMELDVMAYDPYAPAQLFEEYGVVRVDNLHELFSRCNVVSLHTPLLAETENMITGEHLRALPPGSTFINTSRGKIVTEREMVEVLGERNDIFAVLDVLADESDMSASPLARMPNVFLTPHISGSMGVECSRMGSFAVEECRRYLNGEPPLTPVTKQMCEMMA